MLMPRKVRHRKQQRGRLHGLGEGRHAPRVRRLRDPGARARLDHQPPDRGRSYRDDPSHQAWRKGLDQRVPRQARHPEARGNADGFGQGQPREVGRRREARSHACSSSRVFPRTSRARRCGSRSTSCRSRRASSPARVRRGDGHDEGERVAGTDRRDARRPVVEVKQELWKRRLDLATGQLDSTTEITQYKREIARIHTLMREREIAAHEAKAQES